MSKRTYFQADDGKHYWNCWTRNYQPDRDGYCMHAFCEEDRTGRALCGVKTSDGGGLSYPNELDAPSCRKCRKIMQKRKALPQPAQPDRREKGEA